MIAGNFLIYSLPTLLLFDSGVTCSFLSVKFACLYGLILVCCDPTMIVLPSSTTVPYDCLYPRVPVTIQGMILKNLIHFPLTNFNAILGMDWVAKNHAMIYCHSQKLSLWGSRVTRVTYRRLPHRLKVKIVAAMAMHEMEVKGLWCLLMFGVGWTKKSPRVEYITIIRELPDVF